MIVLMAAAAGLAKESVTLCSVNEIQLGAAWRRALLFAWISDAPPHRRSLDRDRQNPRNKASCVLRKQVAREKSVDDRLV